MGDDIIGGLLYPRVGDLVTPAYINDMITKVMEHRTGTNRYTSYFHDGTGSDWTTTSVAKVEIDTTKFRVDLTTRGGPVLVMFFGTAKSTAGYSEYAIERETLIGGVWVSDPIDNRNMPLQPHNSVQYCPLGLIKVYPFLAAGQHRWTMMWGVGSGFSGTLTLEALTKPWMAAIEAL